MTRLYREGRTETVRSCTNETSAFVKAMESGADKETLRGLAKAAAKYHVGLYQVRIQKTSYYLWLEKVQVIDDFFNTCDDFRNIKFIGRHDGQRSRSTLIHALRRIALSWIGVKIPGHGSDAEMATLHLADAAFSGESSRLQEASGHALDWWRIRTSLWRWIRCFVHHLRRGSHYVPCKSRQTWQVINEFLAFRFLRNTLVLTPTVLVLVLTLKKPCLTLPPSSPIIKIQIKKVAMLLPKSSRTQQKTCYLHHENSIQKIPKKKQHWTDSQNFKEVHPSADVAMLIIHKL